MFSVKTPIRLIKSLPYAVIMAAAIIATGLAQAQSAGSEKSLVEVKVELTGLQSTDGKLVVIAYTKDNWLGQSDFTATAEIKADNTDKPLDKQYLVLTLPEGSYGFSAYQDVNNNGELDMRLVFPAEPAGFSNKHRPRFGPPRFKKAKLDVSEDSKPISIELR